MAAVAVFQNSVLDIENTQKERDKKERRILHGKILIDLVQDNLRRHVLGCPRLYQRFGDGHEERCGYPLPRNIAHVKAEMVVVEEKEVK